MMSGSVRLSLVEPTIFLRSISRCELLHAHCSTSEESCLDEDRDSVERARIVTFGSPIVQFLYMFKSIWCQFMDGVAIVFIF
jgi:hypothetical protein